jgi:hypothetical protein
MPKLPFLDWPPLPVVVEMADAGHPARLSPVALRDHGLSSSHEMEQET